jgi:hypothetical protein
MSHDESINSDSYSAWSDNGKGVWQLVQICLLTCRLLIGVGYVQLGTTNKSRLGP